MFLLILALFVHYTLYPFHAISMQSPTCAISVPSPAKMSQQKGVGVIDIVVK